MLLAPLLVGAEPAALTDEAAQKAFEEAVERYQGMEAGDLSPPAGAPMMEAEPMPPAVIEDFDVSVLPVRGPYYGAGRAADETDLEKLKLVVSLENVRLEDALAKVFEKVAEKTGPWDVKWRLKRENQAIMEQHVNLVAESSFGDFVAYLTDRVKNMTGVQLFVTVFDGARVVVVSDTYY
jgi:hypothetical protein